VLVYCKDDLPGRAEEPGKQVSGGGKISHLVSRLPEEFLECENFWNVFHSVYKLLYAPSLAPRLLPAFNWFHPCRSGRMSLLSK